MTAGLPGDKMTLQGAEWPLYDPFQGSWSRGLYSTSQCWSTEGSRNILQVFNLGWHATLLSLYLRSKSWKLSLKKIFVLSGVSSELGSWSIGCHCSLMLLGHWHITFSGLQGPPVLLPTPFIAASLFGGHFMSSVQAVTHSQEQSGQVRCLASAGSRSAQRLSSPAPKSSPEV